MFCVILLLYIVAFLGDIHRKGFKGMFSPTERTEEKYHVLS
jgi:hypothetical protein